jgi:ferritin-like metal-binding protein YciE
MGFFSKDFRSLEDLFFDQIADLYDAETRLTKAISKMVDAAHSQELKDLLIEHMRETDNQIERLESIFTEHDRQPHRETCDAMKGLIREAEAMVDATGDPSVKDAALIAVAQRVEHYEMAGYGTARTFAEHLGFAEAARVLQESLDEEKDSDLKLTDIAERQVNLLAMHV